GRGPASDSSSTTGVTVGSCRDPPYRDQQHRRQLDGAASIGGKWLCDNDLRRREGSHDTIVVLDLSSSGAMCNCVSDANRTSGGGEVEAAHRLIGAHRRLLLSSDLPRQHLSLLEHSLRRPLLLIGRVAVLAQDAL